jgi:hypothetical protein
MNHMSRSRLWRGGCLAGFCLALTALSGCQTSVANMTSPSGWYQQHLPQETAPSPAFPLSRELARQEDIAAAPGAGGLPVGPLPLQQ